MDRYAGRRDKLKSIVRAAGLEGLLVTGPANVRYLTGFSGDSSYLLLGRKLALMISDSRYTTQLEEECPGLEFYIRPVSQRLAEATVKSIERAGLSKLGFEGQQVVVEFHRFLKENLKSTELVELNGKVESELRSIKDDHEIAETRLAVMQAQKAFEVFRSTLRPETTERQGGWELERGARLFGAHGMSFEPIVAGDDRAALPHYRPGPARAGEASLLLVDWGASTFEGYKSDLTRTLFLRKPSKKWAEIYNVVLKAQRTAIKFLRPGRTGKAADQKARAVIEDAGYGERFGHSLGHSIGLEIHEVPRLAPTDETVLKPGMIVTVEPGLYLPGEGGVRIEDDVLVTDDGCEVLSTLPKDLEAMVWNDG